MRHLTAQAVFIVVWQWSLNELKSFNPSILQPLLSPTELLASGDPILGVVQGCRWLAQVRPRHHPRGDCHGGERGSCPQYFPVFAFASLTHALSHVNDLLIISSHTLVSVWCSPDRSPKCSLEPFYLLAPDKSPSLKPPGDVRAQAFSLLALQRTLRWRSSVNCSLPWSPYVACCHTPYTPRPCLFYPPALFLANPLPTRPPPSVSRPATPRESRSTTATIVVGRLS